MKNKVLILLIILDITLVGAWIYSGMYVYLLTAILLADIHSLIEIKNYMNIKLHLPISCLLFIATSLVGYYLEGYALFATFIFLTHSTYIYYKHFKNTWV